MTAVIVSAIIVGVAVALAGVSRAIGRKGRIPGLIAVVAALLCAIWVPADLRDWGLAIGAGLLVMAAASSQDPPSNSVMPWLLVAGIAFAGVLAVGMLPGGTTAAGLSIIAVVGFFRVRAHARHLGRVRRARLLEPGQRPDREVQIGGVVSGPAVRPPPGFESKLERDCAWWAISLTSTAEGRAGSRRVTSGPLRLRSDAGTVLAELDHGTMDFSDARTRTEQHGNPDDLRALLGEGPDQPATGPDETRLGPDMASSMTETQVTVHWLAPGDVASVLGRPEWERGPADMAGYRDAPVVPVVRGPQAFLADSSVDDARTGALWSVIAWTVWTPVCAGVGALQLAGLL